MKHLDFVRIYDGVVEPELCKDLITAFENNPSNHVKVNHDCKPYFTEMNLSESLPEYHSLMTNYVMRVVNQYAKDCVEYTSFWPNQPTILEGMRLKRYNAQTGERFDMHVDVSTPASAMRYLAILFYLNHDFEGGDTHFIPECTIIPMTGSVLVFPPTWQYPHAGLEVISGTKYIMSTYLHYYDPVQRTHNPSESNSQ